MCNEVARRMALGQIRDDFADLRIPLRFPEGLPNLPPLNSIRITDPTAIVRQGDDGVELVQRRWSWPSPNGRPVYNLRSEGQRVATGRCLIPVDTFYEFTDPEPGEKRKTKWAFVHAREPWFCLAGWWRSHASVGEAFALLTCEPGPDVAPYHRRQIVVVPREQWSRWLDPSLPVTEVARPLPPGTLTATRIGP